MINFINNVEYWEVHMYICYCKIVWKQHAVMNEQTLWNDLRFSAANTAVLNGTLHRDSPVQSTLSHSTS